MSTPYYQDDLVTLYHGDCQDLTRELDADIVLTDPPYGETNLAWDRWPPGWPTLMASLPSARSLWCFGSTRMFLTQRDEFVAWKLAQDLVWSKPRGRSTVTDRFARSHELVLHWYRGKWGELYRESPTVVHHGAPNLGLNTRRHNRNDKDGTKVKPMAAGGSPWTETGTRLMLTVIPGNPGDPRTVLHPTQKPTSLLDPIIRYSCPSGGVVLDPFAGSGSTLVAARNLGRRAIGVEAEERYCEVIARRLDQGVLDFGAPA